ncbi:MAG: LytTR family DNA-binding domain-containing protein [Muribaculaceae bacterium]|nr:LytTR family DNA-binding domain-containing protein [Muribaculaceae bacterium]MDE5930503.1 LytTR family DNA-binding domain-containing protein [Muribaculaceae bacterium]
MEKTIKALAIDDEPLALDVIARFCERLGNISSELYSDPREGLEAALRQRPDIVFLDIDMGDVSGLDIAAKLPEGCCVIFTTAYLDYAAEGFNLDAVDYLHKPFSYSRFETAVQRALRRAEYNRSRDSQRVITLKQEYSNVNVRLDEIHYVEAMEGYSKIYRVENRCVVTRVILKKLQALLPERDFVRIHRSYIVPVAKIKSYNRQEVTLSGGLVLPVGRQYAGALIEVLQG